MEGNQMKMREALVQCELFLGNVSRHGHPMLNPGDKCTACDGVEELRGLVVRALAAPARNCDAGTPEEQTQRMHAQLCSKQKSCYELPSGEHCPLHCTGVDCRLAWAQMPYTAEEGGAE